MHVLIVDDSAVVRQTVSGILGNEPDISVTVASDPFIAMQKIALRRPDVILLDIEMPRMDGLTFLRILMADDPIPVVICSAVAGPQSAPALFALQQGAVDIVAKPKIGLRNFLQESRVQLLDALRAASVSRVISFPLAKGKTVPAPKKAQHQNSDDSRLIAIGASTGGTEALRTILSELPGDSAATVIVQHMPEGFTAQFAKNLNMLSAMEVNEAIHGDRLYAGRALIAPGNHHMSVERDRDGYYVALTDGPLVTRHRPSVDVLFRSVAQVAAHAVGVILTGMGSDGADGMLLMHRAGAATIAQDEKTCVVFGMPKEAIARNAVDEVLPLDRIGAAVVRLTAKTPDPARRER